MGCVFQAGAQIRYLIGSDHGWLGGWIGWDPEHPPCHLVVNLSRFLIRPGVECQHLASRALGRTLRRLGRDFRRHYGDRPVLVETFVEAGRQTGGSLLAAGWTRVGLTAGRGRFSPPGASVPKRAIWCRPLVSNWRQALGVRSPVVVPQGSAEGLDRTVWAAQEFGGAAGRSTME